jgi:SAM-dependent methyltransferase
MKKLIKKLLRLFNLELRYIEKPRVEKEIGHAFKVNSLKASNDNYSPEHIKNLRNNPKIMGFYKEVAKKTKHLIEGKIAEFGCGVSPLLKAIETIKGKIDFTGYDCSETAIKFLKDKYHYNKFYVNNIYDKVNEKFDVVFCLEVLEHLEKPEKAFKNLLHSAKKYVVLCVPNGRIDTIPGHIHYWSPESLNLFVKKYCDYSFKQYLTKDKLNNICIIKIS